MSGEAAQGKAEARPGTIAVVVGPSGAGKDTLISRAMAHFAGRQDIHLVTRAITRPADAGGEAHRAVSAAEFAALAQSGAFAVHWDAHGLRYGIPADAASAIARGHLVIANGSRSALPAFAAAFPSMVVINIVARPEILAQRLAARGRETGEEILRRLGRQSLEVTGDFKVVTIDNSGPIDVGADALIATLQGLLDPQPGEGRG